MTPLEPLPTVPDWLAGISALDVLQTIGWLILIGVLLFKFLPLLRKWGRVTDALLGSPAVAGLPREPGVIETVMGGVKPDGSRMPGLGERLDVIERHSGQAAYDSRPNGGGSAFDSLMTEVRGTRIEVRSVKDDLATLTRRVATHDQILLSADSPE